MIHKEKFTRHDPYYDYLKRDNVCRELEKKYGLTIDNGAEQEFVDYVERRKSDITVALDDSRSWQELHEGLARYGLSVYLRGNGCTLAAIGHQAKDGHRIKLSDLDRKYSKKRLTDRFGKYEKSEGDYKVQEFFRREPKRENHQAKKYEALTGLKSFDTFI